MQYKVTYQDMSKIKSATFEAKDIQELKSLPKIPKNIINIKLLEKKTRENIGLKLNNKRKVYELFYSLNLMLNSNITLNESIELLLETKQENIIKEILLNIQNSIQTSQAISVSLQKYENYLGETPILFLSLGLKNGNIKQSISSLIEILEEDINSTENLKNTIRYPIILLVSLFISVSMIFIYVIPNFEFIFSFIKDDIPFATRSLLIVKNIIDNYFVAIIFIFTLTVTALYKSYFMYKLFFDKALILHIPILSKVLQDYFFYKLFLSISIIVKSKYQFQTAIENSKNMINNLYIQNIINTILSNIKNGTSIAKSFEDTKLFDSFTIKLLRMSEVTNDYSSILDDITQFHKKRFKKSLNTFSSLIEPIIIFIIALIVLWLVLAIMLPMWELSSSFG